MTQLLLPAVLAVIVATAAVTHHRTATGNTSPGKKPYAHAIYIYPGNAADWPGKKMPGGLQNAWVRGRNDRFILVNKNVIFPVKAAGENYTTSPIKNDEHFSGLLYAAAWQHRLLP